MGLIWNIWYLDDGLLVGSPEQISQALAYLKAELLKRGLRLNRAKSNLWGPAAALVTGSEGMNLIPWQPDSGVTILGSPVPFPGSSAYVEDDWRRRLTSLEEAADRVTGLADKQMAHHLLRSCLDGCKINHLLRATDTYQLDLLVRRADDIIMSAFEDVVGCGLSPEQRTQASWPFSAGGCGLKTPTMLRPAARISALTAYLASGSERLCLPTYVQTVPSRWVSPLLSDLSTNLGVNFDPLPAWMGRHELLQTASPAMWQQKWWSDALGKAASLRLLDAVSARDQARLLEQSSGVGTGWMTVIPSAPLHTIISSEEYSLALKWWLGVSLLSPDDDARICPGCGRLSDQFGDHLLCCIRNNFSKRHNAVQDALCDLLTASGQGHAREMKIPNAADQELRPADILLNSFQDGRPTALDITIAHGWQVAEQGTVSREKWRAFLRRKEAKKHGKYDVPCQGAGWGFTAMAFGTWGGLGPEGAKVLHRLVKRAASWQEGELRALRQRELLETISLALMRQVWKLLGNKALFMR
jgi:hypothetical protein